MLAVAIAAAIAALATPAGVSLFRRRAARWGLLDVPNARSLHVTPVPRGAGVVIGAVVILAILILGAAGKAGSLPVAAIYGASALAVLILGWMDDRWSLPARRRLLVQLAVAVAVVLAFGPYRAIALPELPALRLGAFGVALTVLWVAGLINAYNFMDGIDGLAAGQAVVTGVCWIAAAVLLDAPFALAAASLIAASSAAFLVHNWSPARVFLGDAGSNFLGLSFAVLPLTLDGGSVEGRLPVAAVLFVGVFLIDTVFTFARRLLAGENVLAAHRSHLYQRLIACGYSHRAVAAWWLALAAVSGTSGVVYLTGGSGLGVTLAAVAVAVAMFSSVRIAEARSSAGIVSRS